MTKLETRSVNGELSCEDVFGKSELYNALRDVDKALADCLIHMCEKYRGYLDEIEHYFPEYTSHGLDHVNGVLEKLEKYILRIRREKNEADTLVRAQSCEENYICYRGTIAGHSIELKLSKYEVYVLLAAILLHDIGMSPRVVEEVGSEILETLREKNDFKQVYKWWRKWCPMQPKDVWVGLLAEEIQEESIPEPLKRAEAKVKSMIKSMRERFLEIRREVREKHEKLSKKFIIDRIAKEEIEEVIEEIAEQEGGKEKARSLRERLPTIKRLLELAGYVAGWHRVNREDLAKVFTDVNEDYRMAKSLVEEIKSIEGLGQPVEEIVNLERLAYLTTLADELDIGGRTRLEELDTIIKQALLTGNIKHVIHALKEIASKGESTIIRSLRDLEVTIRLDVKYLRERLEALIGKTTAAHESASEITDRTIHHLLILGHKIESFINKYKYYYGDRVARDDRLKLLLFPRFTLNIELVGERIAGKTGGGVAKLSTRSRFKASIKPLITLLSERLYHDWRVFFREIIDNAIDSIKLRAVETCREDPDKCEIEEDRYGFKRLKIKGWEPYIRVSIECSSKTYECTFTIEDNGRGMDRVEVEDYLLNIGYSYYTHYLAKEKREVYESVMPISMYGIGFLTAFLLYDRDREPWHGEIIVETARTHGGTARKTIIRILDPDQPYMIREEVGEWNYQGTKITVKTKNTAIISKIFEIFKGDEQDRKEKVLNLVLSTEEVEEMEEIEEIIEPTTPLLLKEKGLPPPLLKGLPHNVLLHTIPWIRIRQRKAEQEREELIQLPIKLVVEAKFDNNSTLVYNKPLEIVENPLIRKYFGKLELIDTEFISEYGVIVNAYKSPQRSDLPTCLIIDLNTRSVDLRAEYEALLTSFAMRSSIPLPQVVFVLVLDPSQVILDLGKDTVIDFRLPRYNIKNFLRSVNKFFIRVIKKLIDNEWSALKEFVERRGVETVGEPLLFSMGFGELIREGYVDYSEVEDLLMDYMGLRVLMSRKPKYLVNFRYYRNIFRFYGICREKRNCLILDENAISSVLSIMEAIKDGGYYPNFPTYIRLSSNPFEIVVAARRDIAGEVHVSVRGESNIWHFVYSFEDLSYIGQQGDVNRGVACLCKCTDVSLSRTVLDTNYNYNCYCFINSNLRLRINVNAENFFRGLAELILAKRKKDEVIPGLPGWIVIWLDELPG